jgi:GH15 family glucan-1,4-alpha-glucosidase
MLDGQRVLPIQQDQTALVVWALRRHFETFRDVEFIKSVYVPLVVRPSEWMLEYRDHHGLPQPSWDLWEERRGVHAFTVGATIGALNAAAEFARDFGELDRAAVLSESAERMKGAFRRNMWHPERQRMARMATPLDDGTYRLDLTPDSACYAMFAFGALDPRDPMVESEMRLLREKLWIQTHIGGCARYERDYFHQVERERIDQVPGNPWIICTLWHAQHAIARATNLNELREALPVLEWARTRGFESGVLAEQYHPYSGEPMSVSPLTWSHATVVMVVMEYLRKHRALSARGIERGAPIEQLEQGPQAG